MSEMPNNPMSMFAGHAISLHEYYTACVDAGFTQDQAFELTVKFTELCSAQFITQAMMGRDPGA